MFFKIGVLKYFALITGKYLCWSLLLISSRPELLNTYHNSLVCLVILILEIIPKTIWHYIIAFFHPLIWKHVTQFFISLLHNLTYLSLLNSFLFTFSVFLKSLKNYFFRWLVQVFYWQIFRVNELYYVVFQSFFCIRLFPTFFLVQVFQWPGFSVSRFYRVQVQGLGPGFRSSLF